MAEHPRPGIAVLSLNKRGVEVEVEVRYSSRGARIRYLRSTGLGYDGALIHRNYNRWIRNLRVAISRRLAYVSPGFERAEPTP